MHERLTSGGRLYIGIVIAAGIVVVGDSIHALLIQPVPYQWIMLAVLTLLSGSFTVRIPGIPAHLSVSETFVFAAVLMFGPAAATVIVVLDTLVISFWLGRRSNPATRVLFNIAAPSVALWTAAQSFYAATGLAPLSIAPQSVLSIVVPLLGLATVYFLLNSALVAFAVAFQTRQSPFVIWQRNFLWLSLNYYSGASVAALLVPYLVQAEHYTFIYVTGVLLPVLLIFYLTFKTALGRVEDANSHLLQLNKLYLSTIETLAMAIDAKDQITHGHIRRVQQYAVRLAKYLGVTDTVQLSAIEAASLLHDMGKLAVPEYILNKPGKLTAAEFQKMKLHASVGADILSAIDFPYPVVPIVRHHHENWDGSGYPDGLAGTNIPIGARILSVVDCFDALTSDRPYRPRLSDAEALNILLERRGSMYDPLVVDAFLRVHLDTAPNVTLEHTGPHAALAVLIKGAGSAAESAQVARFGEIASSTEEMLVLYELASSLTGSTELADAADVISNHLRRVLPSSTCVFYVHDADSDQLTAEHAVGDNAASFSRLRIPRGQRLTGWVAANLQTILNSDPVLDLGDIARTMRPRLRSCLSTPLISGEQLVGVLTLYSTESDAYSGEHRRIIEVVARQVSRSVKHAVDFGRHRSTHLRDGLTELPNLNHLKRLISSEASSLAGVSLIFVSVKLRPNREATRKSHATEQTLEIVAAAVSKGLRDGDLLFRYGPNEFLVFLSQTEAYAAQLVADRMSKLVIEASRQSTTEGNELEVNVGVSSAPHDGLTTETLVRAARLRERPADDIDVSSSIH